MAASLLLANKLIRHLLGQGSYSMPSSIKVGLCTADPGTGQTVSELSYPGYARQTVSWESVAADNTDNAAGNSASIVFPPTNANVSVTHVILCDGTSNAILASGEVVGGPVSVVSGNSPAIQVRQLTLTLN